MNTCNKYANEFNNESLINLKKICKFNNIKNVSKMQKREIIVKINEYFSVIKIQRFIRKIWIEDNICPISMNKITYPCFPYKIKGGNFIYYNLEPLISYLVSTGDFRDPKTRGIYSCEDIENIENIRTYCKIKGKNVIHASNNKKYYTIKKDRDDSILSMERMLDEIISYIRDIIENNKNLTFRQLNEELSNYYRPFSIYFKYLVSLSRDSAKSIIDRTIDIINETTETKKFKIKRINEKSKINNTQEVEVEVEVDDEEKFEEKLKIKNNIIHFLLQLEEDELMN